MRWWSRWTKYPRSYDGGAYRIESRWREEVVYWEGERGVVFDAAWGVKPPILYVPSLSLWNRVVPPWLDGRAQEVIARLRDHSGHVVEETEDGYEAGLGPELAPIGTIEEARAIAERVLDRLSPIAEYAIADAQPREDERGWMFQCEPQGSMADDADRSPPRPFTLLVRRDTGEATVETADL